MIGLSTTTYDPNGAVLLQLRLRDEYQAARRGTVTATLDGESSVYDGGHSVTDQTWTGTLRRPTRALLDRLHYLIAYYAELTLCTERGVFAARVETALNNDLLTIKLRPTRRLDGG
jgi:hypothetical protein